MINPKYQIVNYRPEHRTQVVELQKHLWSTSTSLNSAYFEWKYERNPYLDSPLVFLALYEEKVVAMRGMFGARWEIGAPGHTALVLCTEDLVVSPEHRKGGLMKSLMKTTFHELATRGYTYMFSLSAAPVTMVSSLAMGFRNVGPMKPLRWIPDRKPFSLRLKRYISEHRFYRKYSENKFLKQWAEQQRPLYYLEENRYRRGLKVNPNISVSKEPRPKAMAKLVERLGYNGRIRHVRDETYFTWRFQNPLSRYRFLFWEDNGLDGYLVLQDYASEYSSRTRVNLVDWEATNLSISGELLRAAISLCDYPLMEAWSATMDSDKNILLLESGFKPKDLGDGEKHQFCLLVGPVQKVDKDADWRIANISLLDMANWDVRMIFSSLG